MSKGIEVNDANFDELVIKSDKPVVVDFWAEWCQPCKAIAPALDELVEETAGAVTLAKLNVDENPNIAQKYGIISIPTLMMFQNGEVKKQQVGALPKNQLAELFAI